MLNYVEVISDTLTENVYTTKYLKKKLQARYGDNVYFAEVKGRKNVTCFRNVCSFIISDKWYDERNKDPEKDSKRIVKMAAKLIVSEIRSIQFDHDSYPSISEMQSSDTTPPFSTVCC